MSDPVRQHYLPKQAYLKFFTSPEKEGFIWMYQRNKEAVFASIENVAKEKHLYSFTEKDGKYNFGIEEAFAEMEQIASVSLKKFNEATEETTLTLQEKSDLGFFLAMQVARTPAFRELLKTQSTEFAKLHMKTLASNKDALAKALGEIKDEKPDSPEIGVEEMQEFIFSNRYKMKMEGDNYFLKQAVQLGDSICPLIIMKDIIILKSDFELITSDYPVVLIPDPSIPPFYAGGFLHSGIMFPIGKNTALFLKNPENPATPPFEEDKVLIGYKKITPAFARWINKTIIGYTERFLFSSSYEPKIKEIFDKTNPPKRFYMSSPFPEEENNGEL